MAFTIMERDACYPHPLRASAGMRHHAAVIESFRKAVYRDDYDPQVAARSRAHLKRDPDARSPKAARPDIADIDFAGFVREGRLGMCTAVELKEFCRQNGLRTAGKKADLMDRVAYHLGAPVGDKAETKSEGED